MSLQLREHNQVITNDIPSRRHSRLLEYLKRCNELRLIRVEIDLTPDANIVLQGDIKLNDPSQPILFPSTSVVFWNVNFKGTLKNGICLF